VFLACGLTRVGAEEKRSIEPRAEEIIRAALSHLAGAASLRLRAEVLTEATLPSGDKLQYPGTLEIALRRPDRIWYRLDGEQRRVTAWYDGKEFTLLDSEKNVCASTPASKGLGPLFDEMAAKLGFRPPMSPLVREDSVAAFLQRTRSGYYVGHGEINGRASHHLAFQQQNADVQFWVAAEGEPQLLRVVITSKRRPAEPQLSYTILSWTLNPALDDSLFAAKIPEGVVHCEFQKLTK
jgi:hypothetical protein